MLQRAAEFSIRLLERLIGNCKSGQIEQPSEGCWLNPRGFHQQDFLPFYFFSLHIHVFMTLFIVLFCSLKGTLDLSLPSELMFNEV